MNRGGKGAPGLEGTVGFGLRTWNEAHVAEAWR